MDRRGFLKSCVGGAAAFLIPVPIASAVEPSTTVSTPRVNPAETLLDLVVQYKSPKAGIHIPSFINAWWYCEEPVLNRRIYDRDRLRKAADKFAKAIDDVPVEAPHATT